MRVLGIDTATAIACVGVVSDDATIERQRPMAGSHARTLLPLIDEVLAASGVSLESIGLLAVSIGPGSFTGLRIGLSVAKGLALACAKPIVGVPTLRAYAAALGRRPGPVWPVLDARKGELYAAGYRWRAGELEEVSAPAARSPRDLDGRIQAPCTLVGDGVDTYGERWRSMPDVALLRLAERPPSGAAVARLGAAQFALGGAVDAAALEPQYCRLAEAELHRGVVVSAQ
ncbi:MAG: tRNA (adenosine(37)-N6)-threonylcarbamoyltransferase complex dimerization subunit type 1 TsaB [Candidatus Binatia bacterium]